MAKPKKTTWRSESGWWVSEAYAISVSGDRSAEILPEELENGKRATEKDKREKPPPKKPEVKIDGKKVLTRKDATVLARYGNLGVVIARRLGKARKALHRADRSTAEKACRDGLKVLGKRPHKELERYRGVFLTLLMEAQKLPEKTEDMSQ